jgi:hypothetical protein
MADIQDVLMNSQRLIGLDSREKVDRAHDHRTELTLGTPICAYACIDFHGMIMKLNSRIDIVSGKLHLRMHMHKHTSEASLSGSCTQTHAHVIRICTNPARHPNASALIMNGA